MFKIKIAHVIVILVAILSISSIVYAKAPGLDLKPIVGDACKHPKKHFVNVSSSYHKYVCSNTECNEVINNNLPHYYNKWYSEKAGHKRKCGYCGRITGKLTEHVFDDPSTWAKTRDGHVVQCECGYQETGKSIDHTWAGGDYFSDGKKKLANPEKHYCKECEYVAKDGEYPYHNYSTLINGLSGICTICGKDDGLYFTKKISQKGTPLDRYWARDAKQGYSTPSLSSQITVELAGCLSCDENGNPIALSDIKPMLAYQGRYQSYTRKTIAEHIPNPTSDQKNNLYNNPYGNWFYGKETVLNKAAWATPTSSCASDCKSWTYNYSVGSSVAVWNAAFGNDSSNINLFGPVSSTIVPSPEVEEIHLTVEHIDTNNAYIKTLDNKDIEYKLLVNNLSMSVDSLVADGKENSFSVNDVDNGTVDFKYNLLNQKLLRIDVYGINENGKETKVYSTADIDSVFYSNNLNRLVTENSSDYNNYRVVFTYEEVENPTVYISFVNMSGEIIFFEDNGVAKRELVYELEDKSMLYKITNLSEYNILDDTKPIYMPVRYTMSGNRYDTDYNSVNSKEAILNSNITINNSRTDVYIVIFYNVIDERYIEDDLFLLIEYIGIDEDGTETILLPQEFLTVSENEVYNLAIPNVPGYEPSYYEHNPSWDNISIQMPQPTLKNDIPEDSKIIVEVLENSHHIKIYYNIIEEDLYTLKIEYRDLNTNANLIAPSILNTISEGNGFYINLPSIDGYELDHYRINEDWDLITTEISETYRKEVTEGQTKFYYIPSDKNIHVIIYYNVSITPIIPTGSYSQTLKIYANEIGTEEYDVTASVPTSEDLYITGDMYSFKMKIDDESQNAKNLSQAISGTFSYTLRIPVLDADGNQVLDDEGNPEINYETKYDSFYTTINYPYYEVKSVAIYNLDYIEVINEAIKYYDGYNSTNGSTGNYQEGKATIKAPSVQAPQINYSAPAAKVSGTTGINLGNIGTFNSSGDALNTARNSARYNNNIRITLPSFNVKIDRPDPEPDIVIMITNGGSYLYKDYLAAGGSSLDAGTFLASNGLYQKWTDDKALTAHIEKDKNLYVKESASNGTLYDTTVKSKYVKGSQVVNAGGTAFANTLDGNTFSINSIKVYTPIVNGAYINYGENEKTNQSTLSNALVLGEEFELVIPNQNGNISGTGYGVRKYNINGLVTNSEETQNLIKEKNDKAISIMTRTEAKNQSEQNATGPSFAEYKLIKFPFDVYLTNATYAYKNTSTDVFEAYKFVDASNNICDVTGYTHTACASQPILLKANEWYNVYEYVTPSASDSLKFRIPSWVEDNKEYTGVNGIHTLVVAENHTNNELKNALNNILGVNDSITNETNKHTILRKTLNVNVVGRLYDLQVRDTDDKGYEGKLSSALKVKQLPLAQHGQVPSYNFGLKLGYRFYFDLKTKGSASDKVEINPKVYYVPTAGGTATDQVTLFFNTKTSGYNVLNSSSPLTIKMMLSKTHGAAGGNTGFTTEGTTARQLNPNKVLNTTTSIGKMIGSLVLTSNSERLPYDCIKTEAEKLGFGTSNSDKFITSALTSESIDNTQTKGTNEIKNTYGHWYGEYYLPSSTVVGNTAGMTKYDYTKVLKDGYLVVVFEEIKTQANDGSEYLSYARPNAETQWKKEEQHVNVNLPNGKIAEIPSTNGQAVAIYQVNLKANTDSEDIGTH